MEFRIFVHIVDYKTVANTYHLFTDHQTLKHCSRKKKACDGSLDDEVIEEHADKAAGEEGTKSVDEVSDGDISSNNDAVEGKEEL